MKLQFQIARETLARFADWTGDRSSLHVDELFARRSPYRDNVVHGMLPVAFIARLPFITKGMWVKKLSGQFLHPVFVTDELELEATPTDAEQLEFEYQIRKLPSNSVVTSGAFTLERGDVRAETSQGKSASSLLATALEENDQLFEQINKNDEAEFQFRISEGWPDSASPIAENMAAACMFSTFAGMCIPGRYATFVDFRVEFAKAMEKHRTYRLKGVVEFKSQSTSSLVEAISITDDENVVCATGKLNVKVSSPALQMPTMDALKASSFDLNLRGKVVLITGASRGIGETAAKLFALHGAKVAVNYFRGAEDATRVVDEIKSFGGEAMLAQADVSNRAQVKQIVANIIETYGTLDILVNSAVRDYFAIPFLELTWNDMARDMDVIVHGAFNCCQEVIPLMTKNGGGKIINIASIATENPPVGQAKYVTAKSALIGLTRSVAVEFAAHNIQANLVVPSIVETDLSRLVPKLFRDKMKNETPMKRGALPEDVARAIIFLASSLSDFTTGQKIMVTGGNAPFL